MQFFDELRERPEQERIGFAAAVSIAVAAVLLLAWGVFFFSRSSDSAIGSQQAAVAGALTDDMREEFYDHATAIQAQYTQLQNTFDNVHTNAIQTASGTRAVEVETNREGEVEVRPIIIISEEEYGQE